MKIKFFQLKELEKTYRLSVHTSGKLGFPKEVAEKLNLSTSMSIGIGRNGEDEKDENLYMQLFKEETENTIKVSKAGNYYYLNTKLLFDNLGLPYSSEYVGFDMSRVQDDGIELWKLKRYVKDDKTKTNAKTKTVE